MFTDNLHDRYPGVVMVTPDRAQSLCTTLERLRNLPERHQIVVVNGSHS